ncbi:MAG: hypothetical protein BGN86_02015 [Caulobacterales bacterium 68-7]|nr:MAG: hypothetical protein BGN86_02015 [Caulobacterales bacterium 68-7]
MPAAQRYSTVAIALHWIIAVLVLGQIALIWGVDAKGPSARLWGDIHKADGIAILLLTLVRLGWRLDHKPPALPIGTPNWQIWAARGTQFGFYALLLIFPITGWVASSMFGRHIDMWGLFDWPLLPVHGGRPEAMAVMDVHRLGAKALYVLLALHVLGALKHQFIENNGVLRAMLPLVPAPRKKLNL